MTATGRTRRHVLVVDDSGPARLLIRQALQAWARRTAQTVEVVEAENGFEALRELVDDETRNCLAAREAAAKPR